MPFIRYKKALGNSEIKTIFQVNIGRDVPKLLSGILCPAPPPVERVGGVGVAMFMVVSCMLVPLPP